MEHLMKAFSGTSRKLAAVAASLAISAAVTSAQAGVVGTRALKGAEHKDTAAVRVAGRSASNCVTTSSDRMVGGQRVWTQHGVITVGARVEKVASTECR
jgi:hypothetical protein